VEPIIKIRDISRIYRVGLETIYALRSISLDIHKNEYVALMGSSGSGKSTLMNVLGCLDTPSGGAYFLNGIDVSHMTDNELAEIRNRQIGFVFQTFNLLPRSTALENVALPLIYAGCSKEERQERAMKALQDVGLGDRVTHRPNELSGGQRQRVAIARALVTRPAIILADEPTGNLDPQPSVGIMQLLHRINRTGTTVLVVTHDRDTVDKMRRRVIALDAGRVVRDQSAGVYADEESTREFAIRFGREMGIE